jgi:AraC-like DNA-binding protein
MEGPASSRGVGEVSVPDAGLPGLERSCGAPGDWVRAAPSCPGLERIEASFAGHAYDPHRHDTYALGLTLEGVQSFAYRGSRSDSLAGHAIALHPDEVHDGRAGDEGGFRYRMLYLEPRLVQEALGQEAPGRPRALPFVRSAVSTDPLLVAALGLALGDLDRAPEGIEADAAVLALAEALAALDGSAPRPRPGAASARAVALAQAHLDANLDRAVSSAELEAATGLDRFDLARQFRRLLGTSPYRYLVMRRLDRARALMREGLALAEVAAEAGFADQSHMTRQFRRAFGLPPGRWLALQRAARG